MNNLSEEKNSIFYKLLRFTFIYRTFQFLVTKQNTHKFIYQNIFKTNTNSIVLDCGCGPSQYRELIECSKYIGIDFNQKYINEARKKFPDDTFFVSDIIDFDFENTEKFSHVLLLGLLHHLNDENSKKLINKLIKQLSNDGMIVTIDPIFVRERKDIYANLGNFLASKDRGNYVRTEKEYKELIDLNIMKLNSRVYERLLRVPWFHYVMYIKNKTN